MTTAREIHLAPGPVWEAGLTGGGVHLYTFDLEPGWYAGLAVVQQGIDVAVTLDGNGRLLTRVDNPNGAHGPEPVPLIGGSEGPYRLEVRSLDPRAPPGRYHIAVEGLRPVTERDRTRVTAERTFAQGEELRQRANPESLRRALALDREALALFGILEDRGRRADVLDSLARLHWTLGEAAPALAAWQEAAPLFREAGRRREAVDALNGLGIAAVSLNQPKTALRSYREALAINSAQGQHEQEAVTLVNLGRTYDLLGEVESALDAYGRAAALWRELGNPVYEGHALVNLGRIYNAMGDFRRAIDYLQRGLSRFEAAGREVEAAGALSDLGKVLARMGRRQEGVSHLQRALSLQRRLGNQVGEAVALTDLGLLCEGQGKPKEARHFYMQALPLLQKSGDRLRETTVLLHLGRLEADPRVSTELHERVLAQAEAAGYRAVQAGALLGLARNYRRRGDPPAALRAVERALDRIESLRDEPESEELRISFFATQQNAYEFLIDLRMALHRREPGAGHDRRAFEAAEQARARGLLDARDARPARLEEIQALLAPGTLLLEYALGGDRSFLWAVTRGGLASFELPPREEIETAVRRTHHLLESSHRTLARRQAEMALEDASRLLLGPVAGRIGESRRVVIVGDGALPMLPFAALPGLAQREVVSLPSASMLAATHREAAGRHPVPAPATLAVLADPVLKGFEPLPFSREEAEAILALVSPARSLAALGAAATREMVTSGRLRGYRIIHFATHARLDSERPERSGIALSDGFLRSPEIQKLDLPADLVVLSACQTALGQEVRGEGLIGLTRSFLSAGARQVLVSLWPVEDRATAELMRRFYRGMLAEGRPPAEALRAAQASLRREPGWEAPYFWAGFVLQGDWR
jgi:CHAT domain-containing protein/Flp pilus assembly protein TadD